MAKKIKKLRKLLRSGEVNLMDMPLEKLRGRHVRKLAITANSLLHK